ncbi:hypothetical protein CDL12_19034 [Handroanthus impetiginosus]|uniref:Uncharacterized protein n=1 Tax=Handroanthus impetiginosus TaxID=429701 RepID=A0A2G9GSW8_9LAMI|nr:hypothetical protein CDL12_19034 [Handroanthus impetiginosus]
MDSDQEFIYPEKQSSGGAAVKEGCRIVATTFVSLLLPLSLLLLARLSTARYFLSITDDKNKTIQSHEIPFLTSVFLYSKTTMILSLLVFLITLAALINILTSRKTAFLISALHRLQAFWILLFLMQFCLILGIHGTIDVEISSYTVGNLVLPRRVVFALGLHETMIFWLRNVVVPVVDAAVFGDLRKDFSWAEKVVLEAAFGNLWWRKLRDEAEALVVLPHVTAELGMNLAAADVVGLLLYYLTVAAGVVTVVKFCVWLVTWLLRD